jgi:hypothetical protein
MSNNFLELLGKQTGAPLEGHNCYVSPKHPVRTVCAHFTDGCMIPPFIG